MKYSNMETAKRPQKLHIHWEMKLETDDTAGRPDERDEGFWPSHDPEAAGYVNPKEYDEQETMATERMESWEHGDWEYIGVIAVANILIPIGGSAFRIMTLESAGLWGIESDAGDYLKSVFEDEKANLLGELGTLGEALASGDFIQEGEGVA